MVKEKQIETVHLEEILHKNARIKYQIADNDIWYTTIIESVEEGEVTLALPDTPAAIKIILADRLRLKFFDERYGYICEGEISLIKIQLPQIIKIRVLGEIIRLEKVGQPETEDLMLLADVYEREGDKALQAYVCSLGSSGLKLISRNHIEAGKIDICIILPLRNVFDNTVRLTGRLVNSKPAQGYWGYEVHIIQMDDVYKERMIRFLNTYQDIEWAV